jgi:hypothetical protein
MLTLTHTLCFDSTSRILKLILRTTHSLNKLNIIYLSACKMLWYEAIQLMWFVMQQEVTGLRASH